MFLNEAFLEGMVGEEAAASDVTWKTVLKREVSPVATAVEAAAASRETVRMTSLREVSLVEMAAEAGVALGAPWTMVLKREVSPVATVGVAAAASKVQTSAHRCREGYKDRNTRERVQVSQQPGARPV